MHQGVQEYVERLEQSGYQQDFAFLTATNPPLFDNNCPDAELADLIRRYNSEGHEQIIRFVTPEMLREKVLKIEKIPVHRGDWTDYWNFGCASTARETRVNRKAKDLLKKAELIETCCHSPSPRYDLAKEQSWLSTLLYDEHTWGAAGSITDPEEEEVHAQQLHKLVTAYKAADLAAYVLSTQAELLAENPHQSAQPEGLLVINTSSAKQQIELNVPESYTLPGRQLSALRSKQFLPYEARKEKNIYYGTATLPPFSYRKIPFAVLEKQREQLKNRKVGYQVTESEIITPYYRIKLNPLTGRIEQIYDVQRNWPMFDQNSNWTAFELVRETIDPRFHPQQWSTLFPRDIEKGNRSISVWNHDWKARREGVEQILNWKICQNPDNVTLQWESSVSGLKCLKQEVTFSALHPRIKFKAVLNKEPATMPEGIYFAFPLNMKENWQCQYDTAGTFVRLDEDQLGNVCRDFVTVDKTVSLYDKDKGILLACPDAPMVQIGDFNFGKENHAIQRKANPLLLAWPINNYWDTNFAANQSGSAEFNYEMTPFGEFDLIFASQMGELSTGSQVLNAVTSCPKEETGSFLKGEGKFVLPVFVLPSAVEGGTEVALKNFADQTGTYAFEIPGKRVCSAQIINPQGKVLRVLPVENGLVQVTLAPQQLLLVHVLTE
jgi:hypothetical protein